MRGGPAAMLLVVAAFGSVAGVEVVLGDVCTLSDVACCRRGGPVLGEQFLSSADAVPSADSGTGSRRALRLGTIDHGFGKCSRRLTVQDFGSWR
jgi:hypothetical protein